MLKNSESLLSLVQDHFEALRDQQKAREMAAYMKTEMPFYGIQKPDRIPVLKLIKRELPPGNQKEYLQAVKSLWSCPHREEKYLAIDYAVQFGDYLDISTVPVFEGMVRDGAWWDFIDPIASNIIGRILMEDRSSMTSILYKWIEDEDFWIRRTAVLSQLKHKENTDSRMLFQFCDTLKSENEFFIRKAIGWALREYSYTEPALVMEYLNANKDELSGLSYREGIKNLLRRGYSQDKAVKN